VSCSQAGLTRALAQAALGQQLLQARELRGRHGRVAGHAGRAGARAAGRVLGHQLRGAADLPQAQDDLQHRRVVLRAAGRVARRVSAARALGRRGRARSSDQAREARNAQQALCRTAPRRRMQAGLGCKSPGMSVRATLGPVA